MYNYLIFLLLLCSLSNKTYSFKPFKLKLNHKKLFLSNFDKFNNDPIIFEKDNNETKYYRFGAFPRLETPNDYGELTWYAIGFSKDFSNQPKRIILRENNYIIWKNKDSYYGLRDVCSHQGSSFQYGCVNSDKIVCPYHGYTFEGNYGKLIDIPGLKINSNERQNIQSFKVVEKYGIIYLNTVPITMENFNLIDENRIWIEPEAKDDLQKPIYLSENFYHYSKFVTVNSLDICHIGFVHTFGNKKQPNPICNSKITKIDDSPFHYKIAYEYIAGEDSIVSKAYKFKNIIVENEYILPHTTVARVKFGNYSSTIITVAQPITIFSTKLYVKTYRNYWCDNSKSNVFGNIVNYIGDLITLHTMKTTLNQDKNIIDYLDKRDYDMMHGRFSIKYDMMSNHYKHNYKKFFEYDKFNF